MTLHRKPKIGDLVMLGKLAQDELDFHLKAKYQHAVGLVVECVGIRCIVSWTDGAKTIPMRESLEIINEGR